MLAERVCGGIAADERGGARVGREGALRDGAERRWRGMIVIGVLSG